jgi:hypothetical protein
MSNLGSDPVIRVKEQRLAVRVTVLAALLSLGGI